MFKLLSKFISLHPLAEIPEKVLDRHCPFCLGKFKTNQASVIRKGENYFHECQRVKASNKLMMLYTRPKAKELHELHYSFYK